MLPLPVAERAVDGEATSKGERINMRKPMSLDDICKGGVSEHFARALQEIYENINDINRDAEAKREITLKFVFEPSNTREVGEVKFSCQLKLAGLKPVTGNFFLAQAVNGEVRGYARDPKQDELFAERPPATEQAQ